MLSEFKKSKTLSIAAASAIMITVMIISLMSPVAFAADIPEDATIEDRGDFWGLTIQFIFAGSDAESVIWDFGDGETSTEWNPEHTYAEIGEYIVTQTVYNSFEGGSTATGYYKLNILGAPYVEFIQPDGAPAIDRVYAYLDGGITDQHRTIEQPDDPVWSGHTFAGFYADPEYTVLFDWGIKLMEPVNVYVGWSGFVPIYHTLTIKNIDGAVISTISVQDGASVPIPTPPLGKTAKYYTDSDLTDEFDWTVSITEDVTIYRVLTDIEPKPEVTTLVFGATEIAIGSIGLILLMAAMYTRRPVIGVLALITIALALLGVYDVIKYPDIMGYLGGINE